MSHLERSFGSDTKERIENIEELKAYATVVDMEHPEGLTAAQDDEAEMEQVVIPKDDPMNSMYQARPSQDPIEGEEEVVEVDDDEVLVMP